MTESTEAPPNPVPVDKSPESDFRGVVQTMRGEIDALQIAVMSQKRIWYKDASTIVALLALLFSFGTTFVSYRRTEAQDIQSERQELSTLLQRLAALPRENLDAQKRYAGDQAAINTASSMIGEENTLLSRQAAELAKTLPKGTLSATEYYAVAMALQNAYNLEGTREFLKYASDSASSFNDEIAADRAAANLDFLTGHPDVGRVKYQEALGIFSKYPGYDQFTQASTNITTETSWATSEATIRELALANQHLDNADRIVAGLIVSPGAQMLKAQIAQLRAMIQQGSSAAAPGQAPPTLPAPAQ